MVSLVGRPACREEVSDLSFIGTVEMFRRKATHVFFILCQIELIHRVIHHSRDPSWAKDLRLTLMISFVMGG